MERFFESHENVGFRVFTTLRLGREATWSLATVLTAEHLLKEITKACAPKLEVHTLSARAPSAEATGRLSIAGWWCATLPVRAELVILTPLLRVAQDFIGLIDFLELFFRHFFVLGRIGVELSRELAKGGFHFLSSRGFRDAKGLVIITELRGHVFLGKSSPHCAIFVHSVQLMLDLRLLRENPATVKASLATRGASYDAILDEVLAIDVRRRGAETDLQNLQADRNRLSKEIGKLRAQKSDSTALEAEVKSHGTAMQSLSDLALCLGVEQESLLLTLPNSPWTSVPLGSDASANPVLRTWGEKPVLATPLDHVSIAENLGLIDPDRAAKISGSGFACYMGAGARLERALLNFLLDLHTTEHDYTEVSPPFLIRRECMVGTGQLPKFEDDMYAVDGGELYLAPTAEVPVTNLHREEILPAAQGTIRYVAYTPCFRREAGSAGRETRGLIRMHQFDKVELVKICRPEDSASELESLTADAEQVLQRLGLHYRVIELCTGDLGFGAAKTYDIEVWAPGQNAYLEVSSCSAFGDFQARRMNLRMKGPDGKTRFCHTLNGSGTALARLYVALLESGLQPDGSVLLPVALQPYFRSEKITK